MFEYYMTNLSKNKPRYEFKWYILIKFTLSFLLVSYSSFSFNLQTSKNLFHCIFYECIECLGKGAKKLSICDHKNFLSYQNITERVLHEQFCYSFIWISIILTGNYYICHTIKYYNLFRNQTSNKFRTKT
jgi:hypothetical protein